MSQATAGEAIVLAEGLRKRFGPTEALRGLDLRVAPGTVCGMLGPNGAGKTTAVRILATLVRPDAGYARVAGYDVVRQPGQVRYRIGLAGQHAAVDEKLSGRDNLRMFGRLYHLSDRAARRRADELLERFGLAGAAGRLTEDLLRRHAPPPGPDRQPDRGAAGAVPRRAEHRARPGQPERDLGQHPRARRRRHDRAADHAVPRRGRSPGRPDHRGRPRPGGRVGPAGPAQGGHRRTGSTWSCTTCPRCPRPPRCWSGSPGPARTAPRWSRRSAGPASRSAAARWC